MTPDLLEVCFAVPVCIRFQVLHYELLGSGMWADARCALIRTVDRSVDPPRMRRSWRRTIREINHAVSIRDWRARRESVHIAGGETPWRGIWSMNFVRFRSLAIRRCNAAVDVRFLLTSEARLERLLLVGVFGGCLTSRTLAFSVGRSGFCLGFGA